MRILVGNRCYDHFKTQMTTPMSCKTESTAASIAKGHNFSRMAVEEMPKVAAMTANTQRSVSPVLASKTSFRGPGGINIIRTKAKHARIARLESQHHLTYFCMITSARYQHALVYRPVIVRLQ